MKNEIIVYQNVEDSTRLEVRIEDETVWLSQAQMAELFQTSAQNITMHVGNVFREKELSKSGTCKDFLQVQKEGKRHVTRNVQLYNLDVIISVGYRVKSKRGTQFRIWANKVIKDFLLKGYALSQRFERIESDMHTMKSELGEIKLQLETSIPPNQGVFFDGQIFDAHVFISGIIKSAKSSIILIDNYIDESVLTLLLKRKEGVTATILTKSVSRKLELDLSKHNQQYPAIEVKSFAKSHDRFIIIDKETVFHIGASLKDLGKRWFAFSKMNIETLGLLNKIEI
ncbi:MAG: DNA-binding protein [Bacteroidetes bacterium GWF2_43_63]|nr:MAG: DNA-binding protein [Bacteroidetes bacterium GWE2_42_42]OFY52459.1 MAG: DNA-binding protein [Bacteroidetes bacterium GWF2_43_63]HBG71366.1 DNA-binding protein [Bacteroidales bacterium]HCB60884.1 DNA-binding protein [Bacteroidales bacterium]HCY23941.1 DNA-binding protein [Bacteroidales bacterium]